MNRSADLLIGSTTISTATSRSGDRRSVRSGARSASRGGLWNLSLSLSRWERVRVRESFRPEKRARKSVLMPVAAGRTAGLNPRQQVEDFLLGERMQ